MPSPNLKALEDFLNDLVQRVTTLEERVTGVSARVSILEGLHSDAPDPELGGTLPESGFLLDEEGNRMTAEDGSFILLEETP